MPNIIYLKLTNPVLEVFLRWVSKSPSGPIKISEGSYVGKYISRSASLTKRPPMHTDGIELHLPDNHFRQLPRYFLYYTKADQAAIEAMLEAFYYLEMMLHITECHRVGLTLKAALISFIDMLGGETDKLNFEALRKYITRERLKRRKQANRAKRMHLFYNLLEEE